MINYASATANALAERIAALPAYSELGITVKALGFAWLDGSYWEALRH